MINIIYLKLITIRNIFNTLPAEAVGCPIGADACAVEPKVNDEVVVIGACAPKESVAVLAGFPNESGTVDVAVFPKVKFVELAVVTGAKTKLSFNIHQLKQNNVRRFNILPALETAAPKVKGIAAGVAAGFAPNDIEPAAVGVPNDGGALEAVGLPRVKPGVACVD